MLGCLVWQWIRPSAGGLRYRQDNGVLGAAKTIKLPFPAMVWRTFVSSSSTPSPCLFSRTSAVLSTRLPCVHLLRQIQVSTASSSCVIVSPLSRFDRPSCARGLCYYKGLPLLRFYNHDLFTPRPCGFHPLSLIELFCCKLLGSTRHRDLTSNPVSWALRILSATGI